jgi:hypothetical protein
VKNLSPRSVTITTNYEHSCFTFGSPRFQISARRPAILTGFSHSLIAQEVRRRSVSEDDVTGGRKNYIMRSFIYCTLHQDFNIT